MVVSKGGGEAESHDVQATIKQHKWVIRQAESLQVLMFPHYATGEPKKLRWCRIGFRKEGFLRACATCSVDACFCSPKPLHVATSQGRRLRQDFLPVSGMRVGRACWLGVGLAWGPTDTMRPDSALAHTLPPLPHLTSPCLACSFCIEVCRTLGDMGVPFHYVNLDNLERGAQVGCGRWTMACVDDGGLWWQALY